MGYGSAKTTSWPIVRIAVLNQREPLLAVWKWGPRATRRPQTSSVQPHDRHVWVSGYIDVVVAREKAAPLLPPTAGRAASGPPEGPSGTILVRYANLAFEWTTCAPAMVPRQEHLSKWSTRRESRRHIGHA